MRTLFVLAVLLLSWAVVKGQTVTELRQAAWRGDTTAALQLAEAYRFGQLGLPVRPDSSRYFLRQAAERGAAEAQHLYGLELLGRNVPGADPLSGIDWLEKAAAQAYRPALETLVTWYGTHPGTETPFGSARPPAAFQPARALAFARRAAALGSAQGACFAGLALCEGRGAPPDAKAGLTYLQQAAHAGYPPGIQALADAYLAGTTPAGIQLGAARTLFLQLTGNPSLDITARTLAKIGLHRTEQTARRLVNHALLGVGITAQPQPLKIRP